MPEIVPNPIETGGVELDQPRLHSLTLNGRGFPPDQLAKLQGRRVKVAYFIEAEFDSGTLRLWTGVGDSPTILGETWVGAGQFLGLTTIEESQSVKATGVNVNLNGASQSLISLALNENYQGRPCSLYLGIFDENNQPINNPFRFFVGQADLIEIEPIPGGQANYVLRIENRMIDLMVVRPSYYTDEDQKARYPNDTLFKRVSQNEIRKVIWGTGS